MKSLVIVVEFRNPRTKEEAAVFGITETQNGSHVSRIFINARKAPNTHLDTFFHEIAHSFMHFKGEKNQRKEERAARLTGEAVNNVFKEVFQ